MGIRITGTDLTTGIMTPGIMILGTTRPGDTAAIAILTTVTHPITGDHTGTVTATGTTTGITMTVTIPPGVTTMANRAAVTATVMPAAGAG
jgi:hypothetical protein